LNVNKLAWSDPRGSTEKILERQRDKDTAEWKYKVNGQTISGDEIEVIAKLSPTGKLVIITVYEP